MKFKEWFLKEVGTCTGSIANFSLPLFSGAVDRTFPPLLTFDGKDKKHKKKKKKKE